MGLILAVAERYVPGSIKKAQLGRLFAATADAFQTTTPSLQGLTFENSLRLYARFTREQSEKSAKSGTTKAVQARLFANAFRMGERYRLRFQLGTLEEMMRLGRVIYKLLEIDFSGNPTGDVLVNRCFFSAYYSSDVCQLVSSLDSGLLAGLSGGGRLRFSQRITEGNSCCKAHLDMAGRLK